MRKIIIVLSVLAFATVAYCVDVVLGKTGDLTFSGSGNTFVASFAAAAQGWSDPNSWAGLWEFETTNTVATLDTSGNGAHMTNQPNVATGPTRLIVGTNQYGRVENGYSFDGSSDYFKGGQVVTGFPYTASAWVKWISGDRCAVSFSSGADGNYFLLGVHSTLGAWVRHFDGTVYDIRVPATLNDGWHHIAGVSAAVNDHKLYLDGVLVGSSNYTVNAGAMGYARTTIGYTADSTPLYYMYGQMDGVGIAQTALSSNAIFTIYQNTNPTNNVRIR